MSDAADTTGTGNQPASDAASEQPLDPKEEMRLALERKKASQRQGSQGSTGGQMASGPKGQAGGKRMFRRKSGG